MCNYIAGLSLDQIIEKYPVANGVFYFNNKMSKIGITQTFVKLSYFCLLLNIRIKMRGLIPCLGEVSCFRVWIIISLYLPFIS